MNIFSNQLRRFFPQNRVTLIIKSYNLNKSVTRNCSQNSLDQSCSLENREIILNILNSSTEKDLERFKLTKTRIKNILDYRRESGLFSSLDSITEVKGVDFKSAEKLCKTILKDRNETDDQFSRVRSKLVTPTIKHSEGINSAVGINITSSHISWAKLERESLLSSWDMYSMNDMLKKLHIVDIFNMTIKIIGQIPAADVYIFEGTQLLSSASQKQIFALTTQQRSTQITSMMLTLLNTSPFHNSDSIFNRVSSKEELLAASDNYRKLNYQKVYFLRSRLPARLFKTLVGSERVSSNEIVQQIINGSSDKHYSKINVPSNLRNMYEMCPGIEKEILGQALLLVMTFMDVCVYKNKESIKLISKRPNNNDKT